MDDNIYRDLYALAGMLSSTMAIRIYVLLTILTVLGLSILVAFRVKHELEEIADDIFVVTRRGRPPRKPKSIEDAIEKLRKVRKTIWHRYFWHLLVLVVCGFVIPTLTLYFGAAFYEWFVPDQKPLLLSATRTIIDHPTGEQIWYFAVDQLSHGALNDYPEVFGREFGNVTNNPDNTIFSSAVVLYRLIVGAFGMVLPLFFGRAAIVALRMPSAKSLVKRSA
jgi:hypothetical protein